MDSQPIPETDMQRSSRDLERVRIDLERWLRGRFPPGADVSIPTLTTTSSTGMSSETLLFDAVTTEGGVPRLDSLVARVAPDPVDVPVFPRYELGKQFDTIRLVAELSSVPVPEARWHEADAGVIGSPFFVMNRVDGTVPPDMMPYPFGDNWLFDADPKDQRRLQDATV